NAYVRQYAPVENDFGLYQVHNMHLKINCAQMGGNYEIAHHNADSLKAIISPFYLSLKGADGNYFQYVYMEPVFTAVRFGRWDDALYAPSTDSLTYSSLLFHFSKGLAWCAKGNADKARQELKRLDDNLQDAKLSVAYDNFSSTHDAAMVAHFILQG